MMSINENIKYWIKECEKQPKPDASLIDRMRPYSMLQHWVVLKTQILINNEKALKTTNNYEP